MTETLKQAIARGRDDVEFFAYFMLGERLHVGQLEWLENADASVNVLPSSNRWGKTFVQVVRHFHRGFYKIGAERRYVVDGVVDLEAYRKCKYETLHTAQGWDTAAMVWEAAWAYCDRPQLAPFVVARPKTIPPYIRFMNGWTWRFKTLGDDGKGIDGKSYYLITIDEAGWVDNLDSIVNNVARVRTADVQGCLDLMGTFKPGVSRAFYQYAKLASVYTGRDIGFDFDDWRKERAAAAA